MTYRIEHGSESVKRMQMLHQLVWEVHCHAWPYTPANRRPHGIYALYQLDNLFWHVRHDPRFAAVGITWCVDRWKFGELQGDSAVASFLSMDYGAGKGSCTEVGKLFEQAMSPGELRSWVYNRLRKVARAAEVEFNDRFSPTTRYAHMEPEEASV